VQEIYATWSCIVGYWNPIIRGIKDILHEFFDKIKNYEKADFSILFLCKNNMYKKFGDNLKFGAKIVSKQSIHVFKK